MGRESGRENQSTGEAGIPGSRVWPCVTVRNESPARVTEAGEPSLNPKAILELPLKSLAQKLEDEELSLESVLGSYLEEALKVHKKVNCLTDFLGECEEKLQALKKLKKTERGLLYGVPISLKDTYDCKGHDSTCGLAQFLEKPAAKDGVIVKVLKAQGAIPLVKTNIPQTLLRSLKWHLAYLLLRGTCSQF
ncbi:vitamin D3 hydroxylase-associated protein-like [Mirounga angustirostris]|uniref:vitamin D3 hydroxylase-associated protein-like n=1 Tax=Mirounga angustirostris TaxID=9716 RepID=UPI00313CEFA4